MLTPRRSRDRGHVDHGWLKARHSFSFGDYHDPAHMGNGSVIRPGDVQWMSAGTGIRHSEFNPSPDHETHLLQIWILPDHKGRTPDYAEKKFSTAERTDRLCLVASGTGRDGSITWGQEVDLYASLLSRDRQTTLELESGRHGCNRRALLEFQGRRELRIPGLRSSLRAHFGVIMSTSLHPGLSRNPDLARGKP